MAVGAGAAAVAVSAFGLTANGAVLSPAQAVPASDAGMPDAGAAVAVQPVAAAVVSAPAQASLAYSRTSVRTSPKPEPKKLAVASAQRQRPAEGTLVAPLETLTPSSPFGLRNSPITGAAGEFHWGEDFAAACGTGVHAADAGVVRAAGWDNGGGGNRVEIDHGNGLVTTYNHLESIGVKKGQSVQPGDPIAKVGTSGASTGCHLHFETIENGRHADPEKWSLLPVHAKAAAVR